MSGQDPVEGIPRTSLVDLVMGRIQDRILKGESKPGDKLPSEREMMAEFKVAKSVIREAVSRLNGLHLIETFQGRGSFVTQESRRLLLSINHDTSEDGFASHLWELRCIFEPQIARLAARRRQMVDLKHMGVILNEMDASIQRGEMGYREDDLLHLAMASATHNPMLEKIALDIARMSEPYKRLSIDRPFRPAETCREWHTTLEAIENRDSEGAWQAMVQHIQNSREYATMALSFDRPGDISCP